MKEYFSHDYGARHDRKITALVLEYKSSGYGIFWATCEMMHEEGDRLEFDDLTIKSIAKDLNEDVSLVEEVLEKCISKYKLFKKDDIILTSNRVKKNLTEREEKKIAKSEAGRVGGIKSGESRRSKQNEAVLQSKRSSALKQTNQTKQSKVKKSKVKEIKEEIKKEEKSDFVFWENEKKQFLNSGDWIFKFCRDKNIEVKEFDKQAKLFLDDLELKEKFEDLKELKNHFTNWYNKNKNGQHTDNITKYNQENQDKLKSYKLVKE